MRPSKSAIIGIASVALGMAQLWGGAHASCAPATAAAVSTLALQAGTLPAATAPPTTAATSVSSETQAEINSALAAVGRMEDADTALSFAAEGAALYASERVKQDGYAYCSQAVELAERGEFRESARAASKALHVALQTGNVDLLGKAYRDLAIAFSYAGQLERAEQFATLALKYPGVEPTQVVGPANKVIGDVRTRQGRYSDAIAQYETARTTSSARFRPLVDASLINALMLSGDLARADSTLAALPTPTNVRQQAELQRIHGQLLLAQGQPQRALTLYQQLAVVPVPGDEEFFHAWALDGIARSQLALGHEPEAVQAWDAAITKFEHARAQFRSDDFKMGLFSDLQAVFERAIAAHLKLGEVAQAFDISERSRSRALLDSVAGRADVATDAPEVQDAASLQALLRPDEVVVAYHTLPDRLVAWVLTNEGIRAVSFAPGLTRANLVRLVAAYRDALIRVNPAAPAAGDSIGQLLLAPLGIPAGKRLVIVPHGPLHYLPFQALRLNGQYLIERNPASIAPSASIALQLARDDVRAPRQLLALGNPTVDPTVAAPLPGAEREVRELAQQFPNAKLFFGAQASKANFIQFAPSSALVHIAAHAQVDTLDPLHSRVLLADTHGTSSYLEAKDVIGMNLGQVSLLALSACESGLGRVENGDEVLGFTRSFLSAGASTLLVSLWPVSDVATEHLMNTLYTGLSQGEDVQDAMRAAQRAVLANPATAHPYYWASFNLIGDWRLQVAK